MEVQLMYDKREEYQRKTANKYSTELESKSILTLIAAATEYHDTIVSKHQQIGIQTSPHKQDEIERRKMFTNNWDKLNGYYNNTNLQSHEYVPKDIKEFLIKWWWMGYYQYGTESNHYFNWNRIIFELKELGKTV